MVFDRNLRWHDPNTGRFAKLPTPIERWEIQIEYEYRPFGAPRVSPPLRDMSTIPWEGRRPTSFDELEAIIQHEAEFRAKRIYVFNQSSAVVPISESARLAGG